MAIFIALKTTALKGSSSLVLLVFLHIVTSSITPIACRIVNSGNLNTGTTNHDHKREKANPS